MAFVADSRKMAPGPLKVETAYQELRRMIIAHELRPGTPIDERELINRLGTGRTPLREAMLRLAHERLIVRSPRRGAWVSHLSIQDIQQLNEVRVMIEPPLARRAAMMIEPIQAKRLHAILDHMKEPVEKRDFPTIAVADLDFHIQLGRITENEYLTNFSLEINTALLRYWRLSFQLDDSGKVWHDSHLNLLRLIESGDPDGAEKEALHHIEVYRQRMRAVVL